MPATRSGPGRLAAPLDITFGDIGTIAAAGTNQATATAITNDITKVTAADGAKGVLLPAAASTNSAKIVWNSVRTASLLVYPASGDDVNGDTDDLPVLVPPGGMVEFFPYDGDSWIAVAFAPDLGRPVTLAAAGAGANNSDATALTGRYHFITASDGTKGVVLPAAAAGLRVRLYNTVADQNCRVWAATGDDINDGTTSSYINLPGKCPAEFVCEDGTTWHCILGLSEGVQTIAGAKTFSAAATFSADATLAGLLTPAATELTIATGAITATQSHHTIDTEADAATDDLDTINGVAAGERVIFRLSAAARNVIVRHGTGNIKCPLGQDIELDAADDFIEVIGGPSSTVMIVACGAASMLPGGLRIASGTIANAAVRTLNASPVTVIPAPGAGKFIEVEGCYWFLDFATAAFDAAASGDTLGLKYTNGSGAQLLQTLAGDTIGAAAADYHAYAGKADRVVIVANALVCAHIDAGEWYSAAGGSDLKYVILYRIRPIQT